MTILQNYPWPGNVRELEEHDLRERLFLRRARLFGPEDLPLNMIADKIIDISEYNPDCSFERQLRDYTRYAQARNRCGARQQRQQDAGGAEPPGISRAYLHRLIRLAEPDLVFEPEEGSASASA